MIAPPLDLVDYRWPLPRHRPSELRGGASSAGSASSSSADEIPNLVNISKMNLEDIRKTINDLSSKLVTVQEAAKEPEERRYIRVQSCPVGMVPCDESLMESLGTRCPPTMDMPVVLQSPDGICFLREQLIGSTGSAATFDDVIRSTQDDVFKRLDEIRRDDFETYTDLVKNISSAVSARRTRPSRGVGSILELATSDSATVPAGAGAARTDGNAAAGTVAESGERAGTAAAADSVPERAATPSTGGGIVGWVGGALSVVGL